MKKIYLLLLSFLSFQCVFACTHEKTYKIKDLDAGSEGWYCAISIANEGVVSSHWCAPIEQCMTCDCGIDNSSSGDPTDEAAADCLFGRADLDMFAGDYSGTYTAAFQPTGEALRHYMIVMYYDAVGLEVHQVFSRID